MNGVRRWWWLLWAGMSAAGYLLGGFAGLFLGHFVLGNLMLPIGIGAGVGLAQRPLLERLTAGRFDPSLLLGWPFASTLGLLAGFLLGGAGASLLGVGVPFELSWPTGILVWTASSLLGGLVTGSLQYVLLRPHTKGAPRWVPISTLGWGLSGAGWIIASEAYGTGPLLLASTAAGLLLGLTTGTTIQRLLPNRPRL